MVKEYAPQEFVAQLATRMKKDKIIEMPEWTQFVKTGVHKERPPAHGDWWFMRSAAVLRKVAMLGPIGVSKLRTKFGGRKNRGHKP